MENFELKFNVTNQDVLDADCALASIISQVLEKYIQMKDTAYPTIDKNDIPYYVSQLEPLDQWMWVLDRMKESFERHDHSTINEYRYGRILFAKYFDSLWI